MTTQAIYNMSREFDQIIDMVSRNELHLVERQVKIIRNELDELKDGILTYDYAEIRDGAMDVIKTVMGMMILTDVVPTFCEPPAYVVPYKVVDRNVAFEKVKDIYYNVDRMVDFWLSAQQIVGINDQGAEVFDPMSRDEFSKLCEESLALTYQVCEMFGIDVVGDYTKMHEGLMSRFDVSEEDARKTCNHYRDTYHAELSTEAVVLQSGKTVYVNRLVHDTQLKEGGSVEPAGKMMKSVFYKEPNYLDSNSRIPEDYRQLRRIQKEELERMVGDRVSYQRVGASTTTIATCEVIPGLTLVGTSGTLSPKAFDQRLGEHYAREEIIEQLWKLEAYARQRMRQLGVCPTSYLD